MIDSLSVFLIVPIPPLSSPLLYRSHDHQDHGGVHHGARPGRRGHALDHADRLALLVQLCKGLGKGHEAKADGEAQGRLLRCTPRGAVQVGVQLHLLPEERLPHALCQAGRRQEVRHEEGRPQCLVIKPFEYGLL